MPEAVYPLITIAVILTVNAFTPNQASTRILQETSQPQTPKSLQLQSLFRQDGTQNQFEGEWKSIGGGKTLDYLESASGIAELEIYSYVVDEQTTEIIIQKYGTMAVRLLDPSYHNKKVVYLIIKLAGFEVASTTHQWAGNQSIRIFTFNEHVRVDNYSLQAKFQADTAHFKIEAQNLNIVISLTSPKKYNSLPLLMLIPNLAMLALIQLAIRQNFLPQKFSLVTISITINFLMYVSLLQIYRGIQLEKWLILNGLLTFCVVVRFTQVFQPAIRPINTVRGYMTFYCLSLVYFIGLFNYYYSRLFIVMQGLWLVPQIVHNMIKGLRPGFHPLFLAMVLVNQLYIFYFKGFPDNIFRESPEPWLCVIIVILDSIQVLILYGQQKYGVKFFVPRRLRTNFFNYIKTLEVTNSSLEEDCAICLLPLRMQHPGEDLQVQMQTMREIGKVNIMETPCGHRFHVICLNHWMEHKLQCPLDKKALPPIQ